LASKQQPRTASPSRATKAERKEQARRERVELQRKMARQRRNRSIGIAAIVVVGIAVVAVVALTSGGDNAGDGNGSTGNAALPGMMTTPQPWPANTLDLAARLRQLELPPFANPLALHTHAHLDISVNGSPVTVPADIGFSQEAQAALHTHDTSGVMHMESSQANAKFTLGEFFDVWGLRLTPSCIGGYCDTSTATLRIFVDGKPYEGDPRSLQLSDREEIVITYGTEAQVPKPLPTFDWSSLTP
jgi:hypothetical protein